jgi:hypothetical protein
LTRKEQTQLMAVGFPIGIIICFLIFDAFVHVDKKTTSDALFSFLQFLYSGLNWATWFFGVVTFFLAFRWIDGIARRELGDKKIGFFSGISAGFATVNPIFLSSFPLILSYVHIILKMIHMR